MKKSWGLLGGISYGDSWALETRTEEVRGLYYISKLAMCMSALSPKGQMHKHCARARLATIISRSTPCFCWHNYKILTIWNLCIEQHTCMHTSTTFQSVNCVWTTWAYLRLLAEQAKEREGWLWNWVHSLRAQNTQYWWALQCAFQSESLLKQLLRHPFSEKVTFASINSCLGNPGGVNI